MLLFLCVLTIVIFLLNFAYKIVRKVYLSFHFKGPKAIPIIGNGLLFLNKLSSGTFNWIVLRELFVFAKFSMNFRFYQCSLLFIYTENFDTLNRIVKQYGEYARVWIGPELNVLISDPKDVEVINAINIFCQTTVYSLESMKTVFVSNVWISVV